ncbi:WD40 repeat domain-containing protein [Parafrankia sp. BMG5.11]|uniref:WD40 repeat domain-containing protein n=1 Tax=Parafrankia sp. BMG5.11 TaxID=222540 RepID=UPI00103F138B|nr:WD40 repeat domain-containing protein [Parafrankia sp. BMG5.11]TCJ31444.1 WD40 repeat domain-containing protein [Parafrankia sp. BMG5.11]
MAELAKHLAVLTVGLSPAELTEHAQGDPGQLRAVVHRALNADDPPRPVRAVIIVDQFEELFTVCPDEQQRRLFIDVLDTLCADPVQESPAIVVFGMRADFFVHCAAYPQLLAPLEHPVVIGPMTSAQLREVIERPAALGGLTLQDGLADLLLEDLDADGQHTGVEGVLPLLSHALLVTWQHRQGRELTLAGYRAAGGVTGALQRTADATLQGLDVEGRHTARRLLLRLVRLGQGTEDTRRRVPVSDLLPPATAPEHATARQVLDRFVHARLVTVDADTVQLAHEALIRAWPQLRSWIDTDRATLLVRQQLSEDTTEWLDHDRDPAFLYRGTRLAAARSLTTTTQAGDLPPTETAFLHASTHAANRRARRTRIFTTAVVILLLLALTTGSLAAVQWRQAINQSHLAAAQGLVNLADTLADTDPRTALKLDLAAAGISRQAGATDHVSATLADSHLRATLTGHTDSVNAVALSADGHTALTGGWDRAAILWDLTDPAHPARATLTGHTDGVNAVALSTEGRVALTGSNDGTATLWDISDPAHPARRPILTRHTDPTTEADRVLAVALSADGRTALTGEDQGASVWDLTDSAHPARRATLTDHTNGVAAVALSGDGRTALTGGWDGKMILRDLRDPVAPVIRATFTGHTGTLFAAALSADGRIALTGSDDKTAMMWDLNLSGTTLTDPTEYAQMVALSADGHIAVTGDEDSPTTLWDVTDPVRPVRHGALTNQMEYVDGVALSADGRIALTAPSENAIVWDVTRPFHPVRHGTLVGEPGGPCRCSRCPPTGVPR